MDIHSIEDLIYSNPLPLLEIKNYTILNSINNYLPYSTGFEIECNQKFNFNSKFFHNIPNIIDVQCDSNEQRFRIPNGLKGLVCLYQICEHLKTYSELNPKSGIHYHIDMTDTYEFLTSDIIRFHSDWILKELDIWEYKGNYNQRICAFNTNPNWLRFQSQFKTAEFRIGEMSFDYSVLSKRIIHANSIIKKLNDNLFKNKEDLKLFKYNTELMNLQTKEIKSSELTQDQIKEIIKQRKISNNGIR